MQLGARYFDALCVLVDARGALVTKESLLEQAWDGVPVTDEALTQCIRSLRRALGDDAAAPRFIQTVPRHGYRFIAAVGNATAAAVPTPMRPASVLPMTGYAAAGGGLAGLIGGVIYAALGLLVPPGGAGVLSALVVLAAICLGVGALGGAGVGLGLALARRYGGDSMAWRALGGALGGGLVGAVFRLLGLDLFAMVLGLSPAGITGAAEGAVLGAAIGIATGIAPSRQSVRWRVGAGKIAGGLTGALIALLGGRLMAGSLAQLSAINPASRLAPERIGALLGETGFGWRSELVTASFEGLLFGGCVCGGLWLARRKLSAG